MNQTDNYDYTIQYSMITFNIFRGDFISLRLSTVIIPKINNFKKVFMLKTFAYVFHCPNEIPREVTDISKFFMMAPCM